MSDRGAFRETFARQAIQMTWDFAEANPLATAGGSFGTAIDKGAMAIDAFPTATRSIAQQADAASQTITSDKVVSTDPPYYDNVGYADLSDFFYVWLRRSLRPALSAVTNSRRVAVGTLPRFDSRMPASTAAKARQRSSSPSSAAIASRGLVREMRPHMGRGSSIPTRQARRRLLRTDSRARRKLFGSPRTCHQSPGILERRRRGGTSAEGVEASGEPRTQPDAGRRCESQRRPEYASTEDRPQVANAAALRTWLAAHLMRVFTLANGQKVPTYRAADNRPLERLATIARLKTNLHRATLPVRFAPCPGRRRQPYRTQTTRGRPA
jgi:hypothetical protein